MKNNCEKGWGLTRTLPFRKSYIPYYEENTKEEIDMKASFNVKQVLSGLVIGIVMVLLIKPCKAVLQKLKLKLPVKPKE
jgi:hypothetical protein